MDAPSFKGDIMPKDIIKGLQLTNFDSATILGNPEPINPNGFEEAPCLIRIINDSNIDIFISYDGVTDTDFLQAGQTLQLPFQSNSQPSNWRALLPKGSIVYVSAPAAGVGEIYLAAYAQE